MDFRTNIILKTIVLPNLKGDIYLIFEIKAKILNEINLIYWSIFDPLQS